VISDVGGDGGEGRGEGMEVWGEGSVVEREREVGCAAKGGGCGKSAMEGRNKILRLDTLAVFLSSDVIKYWSLSIVFVPYLFAFRFRTYIRGALRRFSFHTPTLCWKYSRRTDFDRKGCTSIHESFYS